MNETSNIKYKLKFTVITVFRSTDSFYKGSVLYAIHQDEPDIISPERWFNHHRTRPFN